MQACMGSIPLSVPPPPSLSPSLPLSLPPSLPLSLPHSLSLSLSPSLSPSLPLSFSPSLPHSLPPALPISLQHICLNPHSSTAVEASGRFPRREGDGEGGEEGGVGERHPFWCCSTGKQGAEPHQTPTTSEPRSDPVKLRYPGGPAICGQGHAKALSLRLI